MAVSSGSLNCRPIGIGSATPDTIIPNADLESVVETSDEWIQTRTGIAKRRVLLKEEPLVGLASRAAKNALDMSGLDAKELDLIVCATSSPDDLFGDATSVAASLECTSNTLAFDVTAACSGFLFATVTAGQFIHNGQGKTIKNALVIGADALSRWVDWDDRNSCILFGDGAGAMVLTHQDDKSSSNDDDDESADDSTGMPGLLGFSAHSNGKGYEKLCLGYNGESRHIKTPGEGTTVSKGSYGNIMMNGREVYKFATREVPVVLREAMEAADITIDQVDWVLLHQANIRIMETVADRLGISMDKVITNLSEYGNTSAASIPLALDEAVRKGQVKKGDIIACAGFGAGLSWGSAIIRWG